VSLHTEVIHKNVICQRNTFTNIQTTNQLLKHIVEKNTRKFFSKQFIKNLIVYRKTATNSVYVDDS